MSFLDRILQQRLATRDTSTPLVELKSRAIDNAPPRDFLASLQRVDRLAIIAEIKFRSPSVGVLRSDNDVEGIAKSYADGGADSLSVLTEQNSFGGEINNLQRAKLACSLPILRKDFLYDEYDIWDSRARGADAILLIAKMLSREQLHELRDLAGQANLSVLLELHDAVDLAKADGLYDIAWGVNHRNLETLSIDLSVSAHLFPLLPRDVIKVAESGITTRTDLQLMRDRGAHAALVGTSFMKQNDPGHALAELIK